MKRRFFLHGATALAGGGLVRRAAGAGTAPADSAAAEVFEVRRTEEEWRKQLGSAAFRVLRHEDTERPFTSPLLEEHRPGVFHCAGCALPLFSSETKFDSHTGWPSFWKPLPAAIARRDDSSFGMQRIEVHCRRCGGHQGHVFDDGPKPTGLRYCINGLSLSFTPGATS